MCCVSTWAVATALRSGHQLTPTQGQFSHAMISLCPVHLKAPPGSSSWHGRAACSFCFLRKAALFQLPLPPLSSSSCEEASAVSLACALGNALANNSLRSWLRLSQLACTPATNWLQCGAVLTKKCSSMCARGKVFPLFSEEVQLNCWLTLILGGSLRLQETSS